MTQKLVKAAGTDQIIDYGNATFPAPGLFLVIAGRSQTPGYHREYDMYLAADVDLTDVADNYTPPAPAENPADTAWRNRWGAKGGVAPDQLPGLMYKAYVANALANGQTALQALDRLTRLRSEPRLAIIWQTLSTGTLKNVDPNDINGNFRSIIGLMRTTPATDSSGIMMTDAEEAAIAAVFPRK